MTEAEAKQNILEIITKFPLCSYYDIVETSLYSPETINKTLQKLKKEKKVEPVEVPGRKAKGWKVLS